MTHRIVENTERAKNDQSNQSNLIKSNPIQSKPIPKTPQTRARRGVTPHTRPTPSERHRESKKRPNRLESLLCATFPCVTPLPARVWDVFEKCPELEPKVTFLRFSKNRRFAREGLQKKQKCTRSQTGGFIFPKNDANSKRERGHA